MLMLLILYLIATEIRKFYSVDFRNTDSIKYVSVISLFIPHICKCRKNEFKVLSNTVLLDICFWRPAIILWVYSLIYCYYVGGLISFASIVIFLFTLDISG